MPSFDLPASNRVGREEDRQDCSTSHESPVDLQPTCRYNRYAALIDHFGITNFTFSYRTGAFHALGKDGAEIAQGETVEQLFDSLNLDD